MPFLGELSALLTACFWTCSALAFASATARAGSFQVNVTRLILASLELLLVIGVLQLDISLSGTQILYLSISGIIGLTVGDTFLFKAFKEIGARVTMLIMSLAPAMAALLAYIILGETISLMSFVGIVITISGVCVVVLERNASGSFPIAMGKAGILFAVMAAAGQGSGLVIAKMAFRESPVNGFVATAVRIVASLIVLLPLALMTRRFSSPVRMFTNQRQAFLLTTLGSVFGPFLGISFSIIAIQHTSVGIAATIMATVPVLMLPFVRIIYKEKLTMRSVLGAAAAVAGVAVLFLR